jgi:D-beta-D-heptose 7-phosphate kinase/D-beta-D-heptose 1-phosphate adenosyltransferase
VLRLRERSDAPGGAANVAANLAALGARARIVSVVGVDAEGGRLGELLEQAGVERDDVVALGGRGTLFKHRICADGRVLVRLDSGDASELDGEGQARVIEAIERGWVDAALIVVSDYEHGVMTPAVREAIAACQRASPRILVIDAKTPGRYAGAGVTAVKPNYDQVCNLLGGDLSSDGGHRAERLEAFGERILQVTGALIAAVTLDAEGAVVFERGRPPYRTYADKVREPHAAGAGDSFLSALGLAYAAGADSPAAAEIASAAAAVVVCREGTVTCSAGDLVQRLAGGEKQIRDRSLLAIALTYEKARGRRVVFTNGCFDILHAGHVSYLSQAKSLGDVLVVAVNSDESVRRLKGTGRPINALDDRLSVLSALSCIDYLVPFDENTPAHLIREISPDIFVKGGDYHIEMLPEAEVVSECGGETRILPYVEDRSTTSIIERIHDAAQEAGVA